MPDIFGLEDKVKQIYTQVWSILSFLIGPREELPGLAPILACLVGALFMLAPWLTRMMQPVDACSVYSLRHMMNREVLANASMSLGSTPRSEKNVAQIMLLKTAGGSSYRLSMGEKRGKGEVSCLWMGDPLRLDPFEQGTFRVDDNWPQLKLLGLEPDSSTVHVLLAEGGFSLVTSEPELQTDDVELAHCIAQDREGKVRAVNDKLLVGTTRDIALENRWNLGSLVLVGGFLGFSFIEFIRWLREIMKPARSHEST